LTARIQILDSQSANQIAAGEVVERPVSVVKELVENALDAEAEHIEITIEGSGVPLIRVRDDGRGISYDDLPRAVLRHATSKIRKIDDLNDLKTLGFRGEALPSIASVSKLEITTRPKEEVSGMLLRLEGGKQIELKETGCPPGTTVTVEDLFYNTPARRKFLKSTNTEFGQISDVIGRLSLARPDVAFTLRHPKIVVLQTPGRGRLIESIGAVIGQTIARRVIPVSFTQDDWSVDGFISPPDLVRSTRQGETLIVNGRIIRSNLISRAIAEGYHTLIPQKLYPITILNLKIPPSEYDVNVHPTKMEVRFHREKELAEFISEGIRKILLKSHPVTSFEKNTISPSFSSQSFSNEKVSPYSLQFSSPSKSESNPINVQVTLPPLESTSLKLDSLTLKDPKPSSIPLSPSTSVQTEINSSNSGLSFEPSTANSDLMNETCPAEKAITSESPLLSLRPLGQVFNTYILSTDGEHLVIIDQHAAHERINYERLLRQHRMQSGASQTLLIPIPLEFTPAEEQALLEYLMPLHDMGFILEQFGTRTYLLRGIPAYSGPYQGEKLLRNFLDQALFKQVPPTFDQLLEEWIYMLACKESIKAKEVLSIMEMEQLIIQLSKTENPYTCPHGRPTMVKLTRGELERRFYR
jgi:DNA mismatch repair protein MutL